MSILFLHFFLNKALSLVHKIHAEIKTNYDYF